MSEKKKKQVPYAGARGTAVATPSPFSMGAVSVDFSVFDNRVTVKAVPGELNINIKKE